MMIIPTSRFCHSHLKQPSKNWRNPESPRDNLLPGNRLRVGWFYPCRNGWKPRHPNRLPIACSAWKLRPNPTKCSPSLTAHCSIEFKDTLGGEIWKLAHPKDHLTLQWKGEWICSSQGVGSSKWRRSWGGNRILRVSHFRGSFGAPWKVTWLYSWKIHLLNEDVFPIENGEFPMSC